METDFQLLPPDVHRRNAAECAIRTFKAHFLAILSGYDSDFPRSLWDTLLPQTKLTLNLLSQATLAPDMSELEYYNGPIDYDTTQFSHIGCKFAIHKKPGTRKSWDFRASDGFSISLALNHYHCHKVVDTTTKAVHVSNTVKFYHSYLTQPRVTPEDCIIHALHFLLCAIIDATANLHTERLEYLTRIYDIFLPRPLQPIPPYSTPQQNTQPDPRENPPASPRVIYQQPPTTAPPRYQVHATAQPPMVDTPTAPPALPPRISIGNQIILEQPVSHRTRSRTILPTFLPTLQTPNPPIAHRTRALTTGTNVMDFQYLMKRRANSWSISNYARNPITHPPGPRPTQMIWAASAKG